MKISTSGSVINSSESISLFKHDYKISSYLDLIRNSANRKDLVKIRISNHKLMIETGRYNQTFRNDRFCPICNSGII